MTDSCEHTTMQAPLTTDGEVQQTPLMTDETADTAVDTAVVGVESTDVAENTDVGAVEVVKDTGDTAESEEISNSAKDAMREAILTVGTEKMRLVGIRSVSIDDICRQLGISKKTFYVYFESKDQLVQEGIHLHERMIEAQFLEKVRGKSIIQILHEWGTIASKSEKDIEQPPPIMYDLQKYYPALFESHKAYLNKMMAKIWSSLLRRGRDMVSFVRNSMRIWQHSCLLMRTINSWSSCDSTPSSGRRCLVLPVKVWISSHVVS